MPLSQSFADPEVVACEILSRALSAPDHDDVAAPIRAGMRARAIADACERLALPAVLIDRTGKVLHVGPLAMPRLAGPVTVMAEHLVGRTPSARRALQLAVSSALGDGASTGARSATGLAYSDASPVQRLRGVVILGRLDRGGRRRMAVLRDLLGAAGASSLECA